MLGALDFIRRIVAGKPEFRAYMAMAVKTWDSRIEGECPCCGYLGKFHPEPHLMLAESCPSCGSLERQRLLALAMREGFVTFSGARVLHFAPDAVVEKLIDAQGPADQLTVDYAPGRASQVQDIEALTFLPGSFDRIVCSHVLEHVDDTRALPELFRALGPGGQAVIMLPIVEGWSATYEDRSITDEPGRTAHFLQWDHVRLYGADLRGRVADAGFDLAEYTATGPEAVRYRLSRGEKVFLATRPA